MPSAEFLKSSLMSCRCSVKRKWMTYFSPPASEIFRNGIGWLQLKSCALTQKQTRASAIGKDYISPPHHPHPPPPPHSLRHTPRPQLPSRVLRLVVEKGVGVSREAARRLFNRWCHLNELSVSSGGGWMAREGWWIWASSVQNELM